MSPESSLNLNLDKQIVCLKNEIKRWALYPEISSIQILVGKPLCIICLQEHSNLSKIFPLVSLWNSTVCRDKMIKNNISLFKRNSIQTRLLLYQKFFFAGSTILVLFIYKKLCLFK